MYSVCFAYVEGSPCLHVGVSKYAVSSISFMAENFQETILIPYAEKVWTNSFYSIQWSCVVKILIYPVAIQCNCSISSF